jgi:hypothetical protein
MELEARKCSAQTAAGGPCRMRPLRGTDRCLSHHPDYAGKAAEARQLGGRRRRHEKAVATSYNITTLETPADIRRLLEIGVLDALQLDNSVPRSRLLIAAANVAVKLLEIQELDERLWAIEDARGARQEGRQSRAR